MKRTFILLFASLLILGACSQKQETSSKEETTKKSESKETNKDSEKKDKAKKDEDKEAIKKSEPLTEKQSTEEVSTEQSQSIEKNTTEQATQEQQMVEQPAEQNSMKEEKPPLSEKQGGFDGAQPGWFYNEETGEFTGKDENFESNIQKEEGLIDQLENGELSEEEYSEQMDELWDYSHLK